MKVSTRWMALVLILMLALSLLFWLRLNPATTPNSTSNEENAVRSARKTEEQSPNSTQSILASNGTDQASQFIEWKHAKRASVDFLNPPKIDKEGLFCVINPEYIYNEKRLRWNVEDGTWYHQALAGARGAILIGKGNGRPPWPYIIGELFIENDQLQLRHRITCGGNKGVRTRLLVDLRESSQLTKIGIACGEMVRGSPWGYPSVWYDGLIIAPEEVERIPLTDLKPNWVQVDINFSPVETFHEPVRVIWLQFQDEGKSIVRIDN